MSSPTPFTDRSGQPAIQPSAEDTLQQIAAPFSEAANDDDFYRNPLWIVVGAMAVLFGLLACLATT